MKAIYPAILAAAITAVAAPGALAAVSTADAVGVCKIQAGIDFAPEGVSTRVKFRGSGRNNGATEIRLQIYPQGMDSFKATCSLNRKTGEIISLAREGLPADAEVQTAER